MPASFQACYRVIDVVGVATLRQNAFPGGNNLFARFFDADGTPRRTEQRYDDPALAPLGYAPTMVATVAGFFAA